MRIQPGNYIFKEAALAEPSSSEDWILAMEST